MTRDVLLATSRESTFGEIYQQLRTAKSTSFQLVPGKGEVAAKTLPTLPSVSPLQKPDNASLASREVRNTSLVGY